MWRHREKVAAYKPKWEASPETVCDQNSENTHFCCWSHADNAILLWEPKRLNSYLKQINMGGSILLVKYTSLIYIILISKSFATKDYFVIQNPYILFRENQENVKSIKIHCLGLPWWSSEEYALQHRVRGFSPWSGNGDPTRHGATKPTHHNYWACVPQRESPCTTRKDPAWCHEDSMRCN